MNITAYLNFIQLGENIILTKRFMKSIMYFEIKQTSRDFALMAVYSLKGSPELRNYYLYYTPTREDCEFKLNMLLTAMDKILNS